MNRKQLVALSAIAVTAIVIGLNSCASIPKGAKAVQPFDKKKYLGKWYEIARMDFRFERNLINVTAAYSLRSDGKIKVDNQGYDTISHTWKQSIGKAKLVGEADEAKLKVSFFGPFYSGYNVIAIDDEYKYALVAGKSLKYLWLLSREQTMPEKIKNEYLNIATALGYNISDLTWVKQEDN